jgi:hypothetical protein
MVQPQEVSLMLFALLAAGPVPDFAPDGSVLPGSAQLQHLVNGFGFWALIAAFAGMILGAAMWALGSHASNYQQAYSGRKGVLVAAVAAVVIGAAPTLVRFFFELGRAAGPGAPR